ncbi:MAG: AMP-binding protein [Pseudomonadota bacterium]
MEKVWLQSYPPGVPESIDISTVANVPEALSASFSSSGERTALIHMGLQLSFADWDRMANAFAAYLTKGLGLSKGDRVAIMMPNCTQYPIAVIGALRAGLVVVNTNPLYTARELKHQLVDAEVSAILLMENFGSTLQAVIADTPVKHVILTALGDMHGFLKRHLINTVVRRVKKMVPAFSLPGAASFRDAVAQFDGASAPAVELGHDDLAFLQYTGGTTGVAKGAMLTHGNMVANILQSEAWLRGSGWEDKDDCVVTALPLYHIFALTANLMTFTRLGARSLLISNPRDMPGFVKELKANRFTALTGVNTLFNGLLNTPGFDEIDFSDFRVTLGGGMAVQRAVAERWQEVTGIPLIEAYGLTETSPAATINPMTQTEFNGSIGLPISSTEVCVRNEDGETLGIGETGELCIRGPQVMAGYWRRPEETAKVLDDDGWLRTGDIAHMDEQGFCYIVDRLKDMILVSGFNVYPNEVEEVAVSHPDVLEVGVIGVPDERSGEAVKLVAVKTNPDLTVEALKAHCREQLTGYKSPDYIEFVDELPKTNVGKILRRELRDTYGEPRDAG